MPKSRYESSSDPKNCAHPNQRAFQLPKPDEPKKKEMHAACRDCGEEWPK